MQGCRYFYGKRSVCETHLLMIIDVLVFVQLVGEICSLKDILLHKTQLSKTLNDKASFPFGNV